MFDSFSVRSQKRPGIEPSRIVAASSSSSISIALKPLVISSEPDIVSVLSESDTSEIETCRSVFEEEAAEDAEDIALEPDLRRFCGELVCCVTHILDVTSKSFDSLRRVGVTE